MTDNLTPDELRRKSKLYTTMEAEFEAFADAWEADRKRLERLDKGDKMDELEKDLAAVLNRHSAENATDTPDFVLARYLLTCLDAWNAGVARREEWYGRKAGNGAALVAGEEKHD